MNTAAHCTPDPRAVPEFPSALVSLFVAYNHPLLQLKRALDWQAIQAGLVHHWRAAGKNVEGRPGLPWPVSLYVPLLILMAVKALSARQIEEYIAENVVARVFLDFAETLLPHLRDHASIFWVNTETSFADTEDLIIGWQTRRDLQRRGIGEVIEYD